MRRKGLTILGAGMVLAVVLPMALQAQPVVMTVGLPDGSYELIQQAIFACASGTDCDIRVRGNRDFDENVVAPSSYVAGTMTVSGGWDSTFSIQDPSPTSTRIRGNQIGQVVSVRIGGGTFELSNFTIKWGSATYGGGIYVLSSSPFSATVRLENLIIKENYAVFVSDAFGGGVYALLPGTARLEIKRCQIFDNQAASLIGSVKGAGVHIASYENSSFLVADSWIENNAALSDSDPIWGAGIHVDARADSSGEINNVRITENSGNGDSPLVTGSGGRIEASANATVLIRRTSWVQNRDFSSLGPGAQLSLSAGTTASIQMTDSAVALGNGPGLEATGGTLHLTNLTVVDNSQVGISITGSGGTANLYNTISYGNGSNDLVVTGVVFNGNNLIGQDPLFMDPATNNYRLSHASTAALDMGTNTPPGDLGPTDLDGLPRLENGIVDIGCYEGAGMLFYDGFEGGGTGEWSDAVP